MVLLGEFPSFDEPDLHNKSKFKAAEARFTNIKEIKVKDLTRWLKKARDIQWDYKNIVRRKGVFLRLTIDMQTQRVNKKPTIHIRRKYVKSDARCE